MSQSKANRIRTNIESWTVSIFTILGRLFVATLFISVFIMLYKSLNNDHYLIQPFQVPGEFNEKGYNGVVLSRKLQDRVVDIKEYIGSTKEDDNQFEAELEPDLEVGVMGFGLSLNSLTYHLKNLLGRENKIITGELTDLNNKMEMTIRMSGFDTETYEKEYLDNRNEALDYLLEESAKTILKNTDPYRLAVYFYQKKQYSESLKIIVDLIQKDKDTEWAYLAWGNLLDRQGRTKEAIEKWNKAMEINPDFKKPLNGIGWAYYSEKDYAEATLYFEENTKNKTDEWARWNGWNGLAQCYRALENHELAVNAYDEAIKVMPDKMWGYANKADYLLQQKDTAGAVFLFQTGAEIAKDGLEKYISLAGAYISMNKMEEGLKYVDKALEIDPNYPLGNRIKIDMLRVEKKHRETLNYLDNIRAISINSRGDHLYQKQSSLNSIAMSCYALKEYEMALEIAREAIEVNPTSGWPYTTLAETYSLMGGKDEQFYEAIEKAFQYGISPSAIAKDTPYQRFLNQKRYKDLVKKYEKKKEPLETVAKN